MGKFENFYKRFKRKSLDASRVQQSNAVKIEKEFDFTNRDINMKSNDSLKSVDNTTQSSDTFFRNDSVETLDYFQAKSMIPAYLS